MADPGLNELDDASLARQAGGGCRASFGVLVDRHGGRLLTFLSRRVGSLADAEDLTQEALLRAWIALPKYEARCAFSTWLFTIGHRLAISSYRTRPASRRCLPLPTERADARAAQPDDLAVGRETRINLWQLAEAHLPGDACAALWLHYAEGMAAADIARVMGKSVVGTRVRLHRARVAMLKICRKAGIEPRDVTAAADAPTVDPPLRYVPRPVSINLR